MDLYISWVSQNPLTSAAIQFGILGTVGEYVSHIVRTKTYTRFATPLQILMKALSWALLGIIIKYGFVGMKGFVRGLIDHHLLTPFFAEGFGWALAVSVVTNVLFGPQMMYFHRVEDNLILKRWDFSGMDKALFTLIWFWIPAHTVTFSLQPEFQIGLAALWSVVLGLILGLAAPKKIPQEAQALA